MGRAGTSAGQPKMGCTKTQLLALLAHLESVCEVGLEECMEEIRRLKNMTKKASMRELLAELRA